MRTTRRVSRRHSALTFDRPQLKQSLFALQHVMRADTEIDRTICIGARFGGGEPMAGDTLETKRAGLDVATLILLVAAAVIAASILKDGLLYLAHQYGEVQMFGRFLERQTQMDSWHPMSTALELFLVTPGIELYQSVFFDQQIKFQYPPTTLLPLMVLDSLGVELGLQGELFHASLFASIGGVAVVTTMLALSFRRSPALESFMTRPRAPLYLGGGVVVGTLTFYPIMTAYQLGQIQLVIDLAVCVALWAWMSGRKGAAGAAMAVAALIKPHYALVLAWSLLRREHRFSVGMLLVGVPAGLHSLIVFGFAEHLDYLKVLSFIGRHGEVFWANQSMNGLLNRLFTDTDSVTFDMNGFAPFSPAVYGGTLVSTVALVVLGLGYRPGWLRRDGPGLDALSRSRASTLDLSTAIVVLTIASPVAWVHHYGALWPIMVVALMTVAEVCVRRADTRSGVLLGLTGASYFLVSNYFSSFETVARMGLSLVQSHIFIGGLLLLAALIGARAALGTSPPVSAPTTPTPSIA